MVRHALFGFALIGAVFATSAIGQTETNAPSGAELSELVSKADQKISGFESAVKSAKPHLDKIDSKLFVNYSDAASTAHVLVQTLQKNGSSAEGLVLLLTTLDDLSLNAATANTQLLNMDEASVANGQKPNSAVLQTIVSLNAAGTACSDIAELIMHATVRLIHAEEQCFTKSWIRISNRQFALECRFP